MRYAGRVGSRSGGWASVARQLRSSRFRRRRHVGPTKREGRGQTSGAVGNADYAPPRRIRQADGSDETPVRYPGPADAGSKKIARVATDDPDAAWSYPLTEANTRRVARLFRDVRPFRTYDRPSEVHRWSI